MGPDIRRNDCVFNLLFSRWWIIISDMIKRRVYHLSGFVLVSPTAASHVRERERRSSLRECDVGKRCVCKVYEVF